jgi:phosphonate transport system permease protein
VPVTLSPHAAAVEARWHGRQSSRRRGAVLGLAAFAGAVLLASWVGEVDPGRLLVGIPLGLDYIGRTLPELRPGSLAADVAYWMWSLEHWLWLLGDTLLIAYAGTVLGGGAALLASFPAAAGLAPPWVSAACRRVLELARTVPTLVFALIFVYAFGLGPFAGMLAIAVHSFGALGKLFAEVHENAEGRTVEAIHATGGGWAPAMRFGVLPQSLPGVLSFGLLRFEINVREASVLGIVGAGGIGEELYLAVRQFEYQDISAIVLLILLTVVAIDILCSRLRLRVIGATA